MGASRLYGICVLHPRILKTSIHSTTTTTTHKNNKNKQPTSTNTTNNNEGSNTLSLLDEDNIEFESLVCYAFITRFPLFDFFFQVIFDLITAERLHRMELAVDHQDSDLSFSRNAYQYLPCMILENVLERLTKLPPPLYNEQYQFQLSPGIQPIVSIRHPPPLDFSEHYMNASDWALPTLLSWMPIETIVWTMSLLLSEVKLVVIGSEYGMVSCAVMGLLVLLRPLDWVSPVIPMLPIKLMDFIESPVPIMVGLPISESEKVITAESLFKQCSNDSSENGLLLAVLDVSRRELFISADEHVKNNLAYLCMPQANQLVKKLYECLGIEYITPSLVTTNNSSSTSSDQLNTMNNNNSITSSSYSNNIGGSGSEPSQLYSRFSVLSPSTTSSNTSTIANTTSNSSSTNNVISQSKPYFTGTSQFKQQRPMYINSTTQKDATRAAHDCMTKHMSDIADMAVTYYHNDIKTKQNILTTTSLVILKSPSKRYSLSFSDDEINDDDIFVNKNDNSRRETIHTINSTWDEEDDEDEG